MDCEVENTYFFYLSFQAFYTSKSRQIPEDNSTHIIKVFNDELRKTKLFQAFNASKSRQIPEGNSTHIVKGFNDELRSIKRLK